MRCGPSGKGSRAGSQAAGAVGSQSLQVGERAEPHRDGVREGVLAEVQVGHVLPPIDARRDGAAQAVPGHLTERRGGERGERRGREENGDED